MKEKNVMSKINKKNFPGKSKCQHPGICQQFKKYLELRNRYTDWCSDPITREDIELAKLFEKPKSSLSLERKIKLLELEKEIYEAMFLFSLTDYGEKSKGVSLESVKSKNKLKKLLKRKIETINLETTRVIRSVA